MKVLLILMPFLFLACTQKSYNPNQNRDELEKYEEDSAYKGPSLDNFNVNIFKQKANSSEWLKSNEAARLASQWSQLALKDIKQGNAENSIYLKSFENFFLTDCQISVNKCKTDRLTSIAKDAFAIDVITYLSLNSKSDISKNYFKVVLDILNREPSEYFVDTYFYWLNQELLANTSERFYLNYCDRVLILPVKFNNLKNFNTLMQNSGIGTLNYQKLQMHCGANWNKLVLGQSEKDIAKTLDHKIEIKNLSTLKAADQALELRLNFVLLESKSAQLLDMLYLGKVNKSVLLALVRQMDQETFLEELGNYSRLKFFELVYETLSFANGRLRSDEFKNPNETLKKFFHEMEGINLSLWNSYFKYIDTVIGVLDEFENDKINRKDIQNLKANLSSYKSLIKYYVVYPSTYLALHYLSHIRYELVIETLYYVFRFKPQDLFSMILNRSIAPFFSLGNSDLNPLYKAEALGALIFTIKSLPLLIEHSELKKLLDSTLGLYLKEVFGRGVQNKVYIEKAIDRTTFKGGEFGPGYTSSELDHLFTVCEEEKKLRKNPNYKSRIKRDFYIPDFFEFTRYGVNVNQSMYGRKSLSRMAVNVLSNSDQGGDDFHEFSEYFRTTVAFRVDMVKEIKNMVIRSFNSFGVSDLMIEDAFANINSDLKRLEKDKKDFVDSFAGKKEVFKSCGYDFIFNEWNQQYKLIKYEMEYLKDVHYFMNLQKHMNTQDFLKTPLEIQEKYKNLDFSKLSPDKNIQEQMNNLLIFDIKQVPQIRPKIEVTASYFNYSNNDLLARHMHFLKFGYKQMPAIDPTVNFYYNGTLEDGKLFNKYHQVHVRFNTLEDFINESLRLSFNPHNGMVLWFDNISNNLLIYQDAFYDAVAANKLSPETFSADEVTNYYLGFWEALQVDIRNKDVMQKIGIVSHNNDDLSSLTKNKNQDGPTELFRPLIEYSMIEVDDSAARVSDEEASSVTIEYFKPQEEALQYYREVKIINDMAYDIKEDITELSGVYSKILNQGLSGSIRIMNSIDSYQGPLEFWYKVDEPPTPSEIKYPNNLKNEFINNLTHFTNETKNFFKTKEILNNFAK